MDSRRYSAGSRVDDLCRACKLEREHVVLVATPDGKPVRVVCDYCGSQHNFRGGGRPSSVQRGSKPAGQLRDRQGLPAVTDRERSAPPVETHGEDLELLLRRIIREESGLTNVAPAEKWIGGELILRPGREGLQEKSVPIETFFSKIVMLRNRLRTLEQQINSSDLPTETKLKIQNYITGCYGSMTSFNVLFADDGDRFKGSGKG